jgi:hypothetical protein
MTATDLTREQFSSESFAGMPHCPDWCRGDDIRHASFEYLLKDEPQAMSHLHEREIGKYVAILTEDVARIGQPVRRRAPWANLSVDEFARLHAEELRELAAEALAGADELDRINGATP